MTKGSLNSFSMTNIEQELSCRLFPFFYLITLTFRNELDAIQGEFFSTTDCNSISLLQDGLHYHDKIIQFVLLFPHSYRRTVGFLSLPRKLVRSDTQISSSRIQTLVTIPFVATITITINTQLILHFWHNRTYKKDSTHNEYISKMNPHVIVKQLTLVTIVV